MGIFEKDPSKIAEAIREWVGPKRAELKQMAARAKLLGHPKALFHIVEDLDSLVRA